MYVSILAMKKKLELSQGVLMSQLQKYPQFANITFLGKVGETLRQAIGTTRPLTCQRTSDYSCAD
jgi:hypothetical protein